MNGKVYLVGAGPGDPGLLTLKARDVLAKADVIVYDALINDTILSWARESARRIYVGKRGRVHAKEQNEINALLVAQARNGRQVARLKGGDPFLFGRGGEEAAYLHDQHVPFEVVPGVSSALGATAYAGIPLTDRRRASMVTMITGHEGLGKEPGSVDLSRISRKSTLLIFMGLEQLGAIADRLIMHLWEREMPTALIRWGTMPYQVVIEGTLGDIAQRARQAQVSSPVLVVIGRVVELRKKLHWFEDRPLFGRSVVITRAAEQAQSLSWLLENAGAETLPFPTIQIKPPHSWKAVDEAIARIQEYHWLLLTSVNGVNAFLTRLQANNRDVRAFHALRIGAIGEKTAAALLAFGIRADVVPDEYRAEALAKALGNVRGSRILLARAEEAREVLPNSLREEGAEVDVVTVYRTIKTRSSSSAIRQRLLEKRVDAVTFTSSSTVDGFMAHFTPRERHIVFDKTVAASIGPITTETLKGYGVHPKIQAGSYTIESLTKAIVKHF